MMELLQKIREGLLRLEKIVILLLEIKEILTEIKNQNQNQKHRKAKK